MLPSHYNRLPPLAPCHNIDIVALRSRLPLINSTRWSLCRVYISLLYGHSLPYISPELTLPDVFRCVTWVHHLWFTTANSLRGTYFVVVRTLTNLWLIWIDPPRGPYVVPLRPVTPFWLAIINSPKFGVYLFHCVTNAHHLLNSAMQCINSDSVQAPLGRRLRRGEYIIPSTFD